MIFNPYIYILHAIPKDQTLTRRLYKECHWSNIRFRYRLQKGKKNFVLSDNMLCAYFLNHFWGIIGHQKHMEIEAKIVINAMLLPC